MSKWTLMTEITARAIFVDRAASHITRWVSWIEKRLAAFLLALARCPPVNLIGACKRQRCMQTPPSRACRFCVLTWCFVAVQRVTSVRPCSSLTPQERFVLVLSLGASCS